MTRVPVVSTMEQLIAGRKQIISATGKMSRLMSQRLADVYRAMVAAAKGSEMRELLGKTGAEHQASVMYQTFGHLDAKPGEKHKGHFVFINGQHGDLSVVHSEFSSFDEGPGYFSDRADFIWELVKDGGLCSKVGIYRFEGEYSLPKRRNGKRFSGSVTCLQSF